MTSEWIAPVGAAIAIMGFVYTVMRNFKVDIENKIDIAMADMQLKVDSTNGKMSILKNDMQARMELQDERIFQLATGKSLKEAMLEAKRKTEGI